MALTTPEERILKTADLLRSLQESINNLRQLAEDLRRRMMAGEEAELNETSKEMARAETLIRTCQKVEACLVEQHERQAGIVQGGYAFDLDRARLEIGCKLARIRSCCDQGRISE
ncbi:hypothetical protein QEZ52_09495 [Aliisedimentitalea scapharcae]|uniref:Uncharacterized protein n=1 Tax=Aliisedimentitalea scapharcae TaxID=1524259 RepID=A0ABZ2XXC4_9RHOB|nr:hypothetical protein K3727_09270 [Rhodobacteraceae bacterium M382]